jgi:hypothetical protein
MNQQPAEGIGCHNLSVLCHPGQADCFARGSLSRAGNLPSARVRRSRRPHELRLRCCRWLSPNGRLRRANSQGRQGWRPARVSADQVPLVINLKTAKRPSASPFRKRCWPRPMR